MKRKTIRFLCAFCVVPLLLCSLPVSAKSNGELTVAVIADPHFFPREYISDENGFNYRKSTDNDRKLLIYSDEILDTALDEIAAAKPDVLLIPGDLSTSSQRLAHEQVAAKLKKLEEKGIDCYVIPGNHDVSSHKIAPKYVLDEPRTVFTEFGTEYVADTVEAAEKTSFADFERIYADFGYSDDRNIISRLEGTLSYTVDFGGYRLIAIDPNVYTAEGFFTEKRDLTGERLSWVKKQLDDCSAAGDVPIAMLHYNLIEKYPGQSVIMSNNYLSERKDVTPLLADSGLQYLFTGHSHATEITGETEKSGNTLYEICTGSLALFGSPYRLVSFNSADAKIETHKLKAIPSVADYQKFCDSYFDESVRIMMRNRAIVCAAPAIADVLSDNLSKALSYDEAYVFASKLMEPLIDELLDTKLTDNTTVCDLLTEAYRQHYAGDEICSPEIQKALKSLKTGDAFEKALNAAFRSLGEASGVSQTLVKLFPNYRSALETTAAKAIRGTVANLLGGLGGAFLGGIFNDQSPADVNLKIAGGSAFCNGVEAQKRTPELRARETVSILFDILCCSVGIVR